MCWIAVVAAIFCCVILLSNPANGKIYDRCELARELRDVHEIPERQIATWVCIAKHESHFNTSANNPHSGDHGIFQISEIFWCSPPGAACGVTCDQLKDDDIEDDVVCVRRIFREHTLISGDGFNAWVVYNLYCKDRHYIQSLVEGCFDEDNLIRGNSGVVGGSEIESESTTTSEATEKATAIFEYSKEITSARQSKMLSSSTNEASTETTIAATIDNNIMKEFPTSTSTTQSTFGLETKASRMFDFSTTPSTSIVNDVFSASKESSEAPKWPKTTTIEEVSSSTQPSTFVVGKHDFMSKEFTEASATTEQASKKNPSFSDAPFKKYSTSNPTKPIPSLSTKFLAQNLIPSHDSPLKPSTPTTPSPTKHFFKETPRKFLPFTHAYKFKPTTPVPKTRATSKRHTFPPTSRKRFRVFGTNFAATLKTTTTTTTKKPFGSKKYTQTKKEAKSSAYEISHKLHEIKKVIVEKNKKPAKTSMFGDLDPGRFKNAYRIGQYSFRYSAHGFQLIKTE